jgi:hypothetical protein
MNVDYSICNALNYRTEGLPDSLLIYDIGCQWWINFLLRLRRSQTLSIPERMKLIVAVGSFHLGAHIPECFVLFSLHFVLGAGQLDGEILETLWAAFNKISPSARSMSKAHRREVYDDHMRDSNFKKLVGMGACIRHISILLTMTLLWEVSMLLKKHKRAIAGLAETKEAYLALENSLDTAKTRGWKRQESKAMKERGKLLRIFEVKADKGEGCASVYGAFC